MMHFLCIKWGNKYSPDYVNNLYGMVSRKYSKRFKFICYTDDVSGLDKHIITRNIPHVKPLHPDYWFGKENYCWDRPKFLLFNSHHWLKTKGPFCYMDLDIIIQNNIDEFFDIATEQPTMLYSNWEDPAVLKNRRFTDMRGSLYNSSIMLWNGNQCEKIYDDVIKHQDTVFKTFFKGSDNYHYYREDMVVGKNFWNFLPKEWYYSYNRGQEFGKDVRLHLYREEAKVALFNVDITPNAGEQFKPHEIKKDYDLLIHWHGKDDFERLWLPKLPKDFFNYNTKDLVKIRELLDAENYTQLAEKYLDEFPRFGRDWKQNHTQFPHMRNWLEFDWLNTRSLTKRYLNFNAHEQILESYNNNDIVSVHLTFKEAFPEVWDIQHGDQSMMWNLTGEELCENFDELFALQKEDWIMERYKTEGPSVFFQHATYEECADLYKKYYFYHLTELFYDEEYEEVFSMLYNIMPREELLRVLNQKGSTDDNTLFKYFQSYGEEYSDLYKGLYDEKPDGAMIQLSTKRNDTNNEFNDIFVDDYEHNLQSIKTIFDKYPVNWVTFVCEITDPINVKDLERICIYFQEQNCSVRLQTFQEGVKLDYVDSIEVVKQEEQTKMEKLEEQIQTDKNVPVNLDTLKEFRHNIELRNIRKKIKDKDPVWCDARKSEYFYINSKGNLFPCAFIARDVWENKVFPHHPLDYPYNWQYSDATKITVHEVIYNSDVQNISEHLRRNPLPICKAKCGDCENAC